MKYRSERVSKLVNHGLFPASRRVVVRVVSVDAGINDVREVATRAGVGRRAVYARRSLIHVIQANVVRILGWYRRERDHGYR